MSNMSTIKVLVSGSMLAAFAIVVFASSGNPDGSNLNGAQNSAYVGSHLSDPGSLALLTHGKWICPNAQCQYIAMSDGQPFRSASSQGCSLCRSQLILSHPGDPQENSGF